MTRLHHVVLSPKSLTVDGLQLIVDQDVKVTGLGPDDFQRLSVEIFCDSIVLNGDTHDLDEPTPIWDQLIAERGHLPDLSTTATSIKGVQA